MPKPNQIICYDVNFYNNAETEVTIDHLQSIIESVKLFDTSAECLKNIEQTKTINTFVIVSEQHAEDFIPEIHTQESVLLIYIIRQNFESLLSNQSSDWISKYQKVKQFVYNTLEDLLEDLRKDVRFYLFSEEPCGLNIERFGDSARGSFQSWFPELIDILCNLSYPEDQLQKLIPLLKPHTTLKKIEIFEQEYKTKGAIYYYTAENFVYSLLNQALRQKNISFLFKFGFFIKDLYEQLKAAQKPFIESISGSPILTLFRGQQMPIFDIEKLEYDAYIYNTTMFSSSFDCQVSLMFQDSRLKQDSFLRNVLFQIEVDIRKRTLPYAYIREQSQFKDEVEILFMIGNQFKVRNIEFNKQENYFFVDLILINDFEPRDLKTAKDYSSRRNLKNCLSRIKLQMYYAVPVERKIIYYELMNLYPLEKGWIEAVRIYDHGQYLHYRKKEHQLALEKYDRALTIWLSFVEDNDLNCSIDIGHVYTLIGICHERMGIGKNIVRKIFDQAHMYYQRAYNNSLCEHELSETLDHLANICAIQMESESEDDQMMIKYGSMAIDFKQQYIQKISKNELYGNTEIADSFTILAYYCEKTKNYDLMLNSYKVALDISERT
ncbi:unnamed protein product [Didymodactylos carnosus]|uniref:Uncharacterized protein n=1 Tax=Didymodactylos carnosus TaxID=1234261 RepID=A0A814M1K2_9BILA|nr:unnamed protein product [Didymodactylos carnosus]CAF1070620.1 unnamed protein product [Didymodactylos carnosus]CAF3581628.1 unnamed protein product [Didymodactylos carnosus]CAF3837785.1 unnamed protein product [Didymodactylos carnosus]